MSEYKENMKQQYLEVLHLLESKKEIVETKDKKDLIKIITATKLMLKIIEEETFFGNDLKKELLENYNMISKYENALT